MQTASDSFATTAFRVIVSAVALFAFLIAPEPTSAQFKHQFIIEPPPEAPSQFDMVQSMAKLVPSLDSVATDSVVIRRVGYTSAALKRYAFEQDVWWAYDKFQHFSACFLITVGARFISSALLRFDKQAATTAGAGVGMLAGFAREASDDQQYNNIFSLKDMLANTLGVLVAVLLLSMIP